MVTLYFTYVTCTCMYLLATNHVDASSLNKAFCLFSHSNSSY